VRGGGGIGGGGGAGGKEIESIGCVSLQLFSSFGSPAIVYALNCLWLPPVTGRVGEGEGCV
jgi:hypothetical protein